MDTTGLLFHGGKRKEINLHLKEGMVFMWSVGKGGGDGSWVAGEVHISWIN